MKKLLIFSLLLVFSCLVNAYGQTMQEEFKMIQQVFGKEKKQIIESAMNLSPEKASSFWPVYDSYEKERIALADERMKIIYDYLNRYSVLGEVDADLLAKRTLSNDQALSKLHAKFYKKLKKATSALDAAKFLQMDIYIHNTIRNQIQQEMPFIEEFK